jgi:cytochrome bd-type quinol oxidase subunit 1
MHDKAVCDAICIGAIIGVIIGIIIAILFSWSLYAAMKKVPQEKRVFPAWFCWMFLIPIAGFVFEWIMLPFGIPKTFKQYLPKNQAAQDKAGNLFGVGLAYVILLWLLFIPYINILAGIAALVLFIIYWVQVVAFKKRFLVKK